MITTWQKANLALIAMLCAFLFSCDIEFWKDPSLVIAEVDNSRLHIHELRETNNNIDGPVSKEEWARRIEYWVNFEVMYKEALKQGLQKDPATQKLIKDAERKILVDRLRMAIGNTIDTESDKELQEFYENNKEMFRIDSASFIPFSKALPRIQSIILSEKRIKKEKKWLAEIKNHYSIEVYPQYLDSL
jgi:hypothetical protein